MGTNQDPGDQSGVSKQSCRQAAQRVYSTPRRPVYGVPVDPALFLAAFLQDLLNQQTPDHWLRRAAEWDAIDPHVALQCRRHAALLLDADDDQISPEVWAVLAEVVAA
ncbi:hypothetical protein [Kribbella sp.]|uniref:hypothetical protein n=1 Tax=Kribbella sp. TaxID=1871183 RepID=UPI002D5D4D78|nr:hypothetical protein [Kribbella sp.]HZX05679.1 hypothetical protein [Kribbella sp.]